MRLRWIFVGSAGIRAGWSMLIFVVLVVAQIAVVALIAGAITHKVDFRKAVQGDISPITQLSTEAVFVIAMLVATLVMSRIEGRSLFSYGLGGTKRLRHCAYGAVSGLLAMLVLAAILVLTHNLVIDGLALHGATILAYAAIWGFIFFLVGVAEEGQFRGYLLYTLTRGTNFFWASIIMALFFGAVHSQNPGEAPFGLINVIAIGLVFTYSLWLTGSLWWAIGAHAAWDWTQSYALGVADSGLHMKGHLLASHPGGAPLLSGGTTGPEGSLYSFAVLALLAAGLYLAWGKRKAITP